MRGSSTKAKAAETPVEAPAAAAAEPAVEAPAEEAAPKPKGRRKAAPKAAKAKDDAAPKTEETEKQSDAVEEAKADGTGYGADSHMLEAAVEAMRQSGVEVHFLEGVSDGRLKSVYTRDPFVMVKGGAIICRMGARIRELPDGLTIAIRERMAGYAAALINKTR